MPGVTGFVPEGGVGIYGDVKWTFEATGGADALAVSSKRQTGKIRVDHNVWVYFADARTAPAYYVLHHMALSADPTTGGGALANKSDARGYFNSSVLVRYVGAPVVSTGCEVTKEAHTPNNGDDQFDAIVDGPELEIFGKTVTGTGRTVFKPSYQVRNRVDKWTLRDAGTPSWELYQREVWTAADVDGPEGGKFDVKVPDDLVDELFDGAFGRIKEMPKTSFAPLSCQMLVVWRIEKSGTTPFTRDSRAATLTLNLEHMQRLNLFHNGNLGSNHEPRRLCGLIGKSETKTLDLNAIAVPHGK